MSKEYIIIGSGGHASVITEILLKQKKDILGYVTKNKTESFINFRSSKIICSDEEAISQYLGKVNFINGVGNIPNSKIRQKLNTLYKSRGVEFSSVISETAHISSDVKISKDIQIFPNSILNPGVIVKSNSIINTGAIIEHDCFIGEDSHISPGAILCGNVKVGNGVFVGAGAVVIQNIEIGDNCIIGAGAVITKNIPSNMIVYPSKSIVKEKGNL